MGNEPEPIEVQVRNYEELIDNLYKLALQYRESFQGMAVSRDGGADIFVAVQDKGQRQRHVFRNLNPDSMRSFGGALRANGYLQGGVILHENIIHDVNEHLAMRREEMEHAEACEKERQRRAETDKLMERRASIRWRVSLLVKFVAPIAAGVITALLANHYSSGNLRDRVNVLEKDVAFLKASVQAVASGASHPNSKAAPSP